MRRPAPPATIHTKKANFVPYTIPLRHCQFLHFQLDRRIILAGDIFAHIINGGNIRFGGKSGFLTEQIGLLQTSQRGDGIVQIPCSFLEPYGKLLNVRPFNRKIPRRIFIHFYNGIVYGTKFAFLQELAVSQENMGNYLPAGKVGLSPDTYSFDVNINDMNYEFQFTLADGESNRDLQERLARLINNSDIGLKARVQEITGRSSLVLESEATGLSAGKSELFRISDEHTSKCLLRG